MRAILKSKHQRFYNSLQVIKDRQTAGDLVLNEMEEEMLHQYKLYIQKTEELQAIVQQYEEKQKNIRNRIRQLQRSQYDTKFISLAPSADS